MFFAFARQRHIVILRFGVVEFAYWNQRDARSVFHHQSLRELPGGPRCGGQLSSPGKLLRIAFFHALQARAKPVFPYRLQQIIHRVHFKRFHRVLVVGRYENDRQIRSNQFQYVEARQLWHLHIQKKQVGLMLSNCFHRFQAVSAFRDDFDCVVRAQQFAQHLPSQFFIIYHDCPQLFRFGLAHFGSPDFAAAISALAVSARTARADADSVAVDSSEANSAGNDMVTRNLSSSASARNVASFPYRASRRLRTFFNPTPLRFRTGASSSRSFSTNIAKRPSRTLASRRIIPPSSIEAIPWLTAFSKSGCSSSAGIMQRFA